MVFVAFLIWLRISETLSIKFLKARGNWGCILRNGTLILKPSHFIFIWMCLLDLENLTISIPIFCLISHPSVYHFWKKAHNFTKLGFVYNNLPQIHPIYVTWAPSSLMKTPRSLLSSRKSIPKDRHIYVYNRGGPVKLDSMWQHRLTRLVRDRYMYSIRITV